MSDHFEWLFHAARQTDPGFDAAFSGVICNSEQAALIDGGLRWHRNVYLFGFRGEIHNIYDITQDIGTNSFVAKSELLNNGFTTLPEMDTAEDSLLAAFITRRKRPVFSYKATAFLLRGFVEQSEWERSPSRRTDFMTVGLRASFLFGPAWINTGSVQSLLRVWQALSTATKEARQPSPSLREVLGEPLHSADFEEGWELLDRMTVGKAGPGRRKPSSTRRHRAGHVCYGPYICLVAGRYRVDFDLAPPTGRDRPRFRSNDRRCGRCRYPGRLGGRGDPLRPQ